MKTPLPVKRPRLDEAIAGWKSLLAGRGFATDLFWVYEENLCFEKNTGGAGGWQTAYQTRFTTPSEDALEITFDHFSETEARVVFYRLGSRAGKSICALLCDPWFEGKGQEEGYLRRDDWNLSFHPGPDQAVEEVTDLSRWLRRIRRGRPLHALDFCMALAMIDEIKIHGRPLAPYERYADSLISRLRRVLGK